MKGRNQNEVIYQRSNVYMSPVLCVRAVEMEGRNYIRLAMETIDEFNTCNDMQGTQ